MVTDDHGDLVAFDKQGDGVSRYNIMNFRRNVDTGKYGYFSVGRWANGALRYILLFCTIYVFPSCDDSIFVLLQAKVIVSLSMVSPMTSFMAINRIRSL